MYFHTLSAALAMDGHGAFVWSAYLIALVVVVLLLVAPRRRQKRILGQLAGELKRSQQGPTANNEGI